jgi:hypothetical protein
MKYRALAALATTAATALIATLTLTGCESDDAQTSDDRTDNSSHAPGFADFHRAIRLNDMAEAYPRAMIRTMYDQMCSLHRDDRSQILDNYKSLTPHDIEEMDDITATMC